jgi:hypothetical protein
MRWKHDAATSSLLENHRTEGKDQRVCPTCRSDVPQEDAHFRRDGTCSPGWPRSFFFKGDWIIEVVSGVYRAVAV